MPEAVRVVLSVLGIIIVLFGCYYATYYIGLKASGQSRNKRYGGASRSISLLERFAISKDKSFCVVEIAGKIYIVGVTNQSMTVLDTLEAEEYEQFKAESNGRVMWPTMPGAMYGGGLVGKLSSFIAQKMTKSDGTKAAGTETTGAKTSEATGAGIDNSDTFKNNMDSARERSVSGQPDQKKPERPDSSEVDE